MARKKTNKSQAIRDMIAANPKAKSSEIVKLLAEKGIKVSTTLVYGVKAQGKAKKRKQKREKVMAAGRSVNGDPVELLRGIKDLAARAGGIRNLKEFVDLLAD
ncbi:MAG: hypothetical protein K2R98_05340 [Gemmataceae bacterium]|nr:hypothetical protein [Gemmataceae bacterium]